MPGCSFSCFRGVTLKQCKDFDKNLYYRTGKSINEVWKREPTATF
jgi:hypothetical protein